MKFRLVGSPQEAVQQLFEQGLVDYGPPPIEDCQGRHPLIEGLISRYLPVPADVPLDWLCSDRFGYAGRSPISRGVPPPSILGPAI